MNPPRFPAFTAVRSAVAWSLGLAMLLGGGVQAEDWPQFRGPQRDGVCREMGLLETFPADGLKTKWRAPVGCGWASPVVAQGRVFLTDAELKKPVAKERVLCFDEATGRPLWTFAYEVAYSDWAFVPGQGGGPSATPVVEAGRIYAVGGNGLIHCLDAATGAVIWAHDLRKEYEVREFQCRASPLIEGNLFIIAAGARPGAGVLALDKHTGREVWKALDEAVANSSPVVIEAGGQRQLIVWTGDSLSSLNPATGAIWWREVMTTSNNDSIPAPVIEGNRLLVSGLMLELSATEPKATILWPASPVVTKRLLSNTSSPILREGYVYSAKSGGELVCLKGETGEVVWKADAVTASKAGASINITPCGDTAYLFTDQGRLIHARLAPAGYQEISRTHLIDPTSPFGGRNCAWAPLAWVNGCVFARSDAEIICVPLLK